MFPYSEEFMNPSHPWDLLVEYEQPFLELHSLALHFQTTSGSSQYQRIILQMVYHLLDSMGPRRHSSTLSHNQSQTQIP
jgi:hypothetical protein